MNQREKLVAEAQAKGLTFPAEATVPQLKKLLKAAGTEGEAHPGAEKAKNGESLPPENPDSKGGITTTTDLGAASAAKPGRSEAKEVAAFNKTANTTKAMLDAQPKVSVYIPLMQGEPKGTQLPVEINGHHMNVPKGIPGVLVPQAVAEIVNQSLGIYDEASEALRSPNNPDRPMRLDLQSDADRSRLDS